MGHMQVDAPLSHEPMQDRLSSHSRASSSHHSHHKPNAHRHSHSLHTSVGDFSRQVEVRAMELTRRIKRCHSWRELETLFQEVTLNPDLSNLINPIHVSAIMVALKRLVPSSIREASATNRDSGYNSYGASLESDVKDLDGSRMSQRHAHLGGGGLGRRVVRERREMTSFISHILTSTLHLIPTFGPVEISAVLHALARLKTTPPSPWLKSLLRLSYQKMTATSESGGGSDFFQADHLSLLISSLATIGINPGPKWIQALCDTSESYLERTASSISMDKKLLDRYLSSGDLDEDREHRSSTMVNWEDLSWISFSSEGLSKLAWGLAKFQYPVSTSWALLYLDEVMRRCSVSFWSPNTLDDRPKPLMYRSIREAGKMVAYALDASMAEKERITWGVDEVEEEEEEVAVSTDGYAPVWNESSSWTQEQQRQLNQEGGRGIAAQVGPMDSHQLSNHIWAVVNLGLSPSKKWLQVIGARAEALLSQGLKTAHGSSSSFPGRINSWEASIFIWGLYTLGHDPDKGSWMKLAALTSLETMTEAEPEHLTRVLWTIASITASKPPIATIKISEAVIPTTSDLDQSNCKPMAKEDVAKGDLGLGWPSLWPHSQVLSRPTHISPPLSLHQERSPPSSVGPRKQLPSELSLLPPSWVSRFFQQTSVQIFSFSGQSFSTCLWSFAKLRIKPPDNWLEGVLIAIFEQEFDQFGPQEMANTIWALSKFRTHPDEAWLDLFWSQSYSVMEAMDPQHLVTIMRSVAVLNLQPPRKWTARFIQTCLPLMMEFGAEGHSSLLWSFAMLEISPSRKFTDAFFKASLSYLDEATHNTHGVVPTHNAHGDVDSDSLMDKTDKNELEAEGGREQHDDSFLPGFAKSSNSRLGMDSGLIVQRTCWSLAKIGIVSPPVLWSAKILSSTFEGMPNFSIFNLAGLIYSLRVMEVTPEPKWTQRFVLVVDSKLSSLVSSLTSPPPAAEDNAAVVVDGDDGSRESRRDVLREKREDALGKIIWGVELLDEQANQRWKKCLV